MSSKRLLVLIVGETCAGKDTVVKMLCEKFNTSYVVSYTTRPMRASDKQGVNHHFVSKEVFDDITKNNDILAYTKIGKDEYCALKSQLDDAMFYIVDPDGVDWFRENSDCDYDTLTIYITLPFAERKRRAEVRSDNLDLFNYRVKAETESFNAFALSKNYDYSIVNWYSKDTAEVVEKIINYHLSKIDD